MAERGTVVKLKQDKQFLLRRYINMLASMNDKMKVLNMQIKQLDPTTLHRSNF